MFSSRIKVRIDKSLYKRLEKVAGAAGYSSLDEFIVHVLEREAEKFDEIDDTEVEKRLRGLGYIE